MADHARQVRAHVAQLASKGYAAHVHPTPDFVVLFLPGEMFFSAALEEDPTLIEYGIGLDQRVIPASPTTLIALLRAVAYGWQQQAMEENARKISDLGRSLYDAVRVLGGHVDTLGGRLKSVLEAYNNAVGSLESNVLVKARRIKELQADRGSEEIKVLEPIDRVPRMLQARELTDGLPFTESDPGEPGNPSGDPGNPGGPGTVDAPGGQTLLPAANPRRLGVSADSGRSADPGQPSEPVGSGGPRRGGAVGRT
jgi:hypothetical protein